MSGLSDYLVSYILAYGTCGYLPAREHVQRINGHNNLVAVWENALLSYIMPMDITVAKVNILNGRSCKERI